jgi:hypothetical protein
LEKRCRSSMTPENDPKIPTACTPFGSIFYRLNFWFFEKFSMFVSYRLSLLALRLRGARRDA